MKKPNWAGAPAWANFGGFMIICIPDKASALSSDELHKLAEKATASIVLRNPPALSVGTLCRLMDDCLPEQIDDEKDMQRLIEKLWPALCCEFELDAIVRPIVEVGVDN